MRRGKRLAYALRHHPEVARITLEPGGWADLDDLLAGLGWSRPILMELVEGDDKGRYELSEDGRKIRALHGHSVDVDLGYEPVTPPPVLYHGTATRFVSSIESQGLLPMRRQFVHLSSSEEEAVSVGARHGRPVVLQVDAQAMADAGYEFHLSGDGVWLVSDVPPRFLSG